MGASGRHAQDFEVSVPSGKIHNLINTSVLCCLGAGTLYLNATDRLSVPTPWLAGFGSAFWLGTFLLSPDLDLADQQNVNSKRSWGIFGTLWYPYGTLFSHRGLSHSWILGPLTRLAYLGLILLPVFLLTPLLIPNTLKQLSALSWPTLWATLLGYYVSQWLHLLADGIFPGHSFRWIRSKSKRSKKQRRKR